MHMYFWPFSERTGKNYVFFGSSGHIFEILSKWKSLEQLLGSFGTTYVKEILLKDEVDFFYFVNAALDIYICSSHFWVKIENVDTKHVLK